MLGTELKLSGLEHVKLNAVVTRADGTTEDLGLIYYKDSNPFKTLAWRLKMLLMATIREIRG